MLAGVGVSWYTWLEQGRDVVPSADVLDAIARVVRLTPAERVHLFDLAGVAVPRPGGDYTREAPEELRQLVEALAPYPAFLVNPRADILVWNEGAVRLLGWPEPGPDGRRNLMWWLFAWLDGSDRQRESTARATLARFRAEHARYYGHPDFVRLVDALLEASPRFRELWPRHEVLDSQIGTKQLDHPELGPLTVFHLQSIPTSHPDLRLAQFIPADDRSRAVLAEVATPVAGPTPEQ